MIVCPVCEHAQPQGAECDVCGRRLAAPSAADHPPPRVEGLEPTAAAPVAAAVAILPDLEPTRHAPAGAGADRMPELEATQAPPVDVDVAPVPDVERTAAELPGDAPAAPPALVVCRYCRTPAMPGERICARCGMRLPVLASAAAPDDAAGGWRCSCGTLARGSLCPGCGARRGGHEPA
jgi:hypothetical protein